MGDPVTSNQSTATVSAIANAALSLTKTASPTTITRAGQTVTFTFAVTNSGNQTVSTIAVTDINRAPAGPLSGPVTCAATSLAAGASTTCTGSYVASQADVDHGSIADTAVASGLDPAANPVSSNASTAIVTVTQSPALSVAKTVAPTTISRTGQQVTYSFVVTNRGNVTITGVSIADSFSSPAGPPATPVCPTTALAPGASLTCTAPYTATQADVDNGRIENTATASGVDPNGGPVTAPPDTATVIITATPTMSLTKTAVPATVTTAGQTVDYTFAVVNTGNVTLAPISVADTLAPPAAPALAVTCPKSTLPPGSSTTCTASHTVSQADLDNGSISNSATAHSTDPSGGPVTSSPSTATVAVTQQASLSVSKSASPTTIAAAGQAVTYAFVVTNTGNLTVTAIVIHDALAAPATPQLPAISCPVTALAPSASTTCSATYTATQADVDNGSIDNSATATGQDPAGNPVESTPSTASVGVSANPSLALSKTVSPTTYNALGQTLTYTFTVTNDGNQTIGALAIADPMFSGANAATCAATTLAPTVKTTCTAQHIVTQADLDAGSIANTATAAGTAPGGGAITSPPSSASASANQSAALSLLKTASPTTISAAGTEISYTFRVTNIGNVTIAGLSHRRRLHPAFGADQVDHLRHNDTGTRRSDQLHDVVHGHPGRHRQRRDHEHRDGRRHRPGRQPGQLAAVHRRGRRRCERRPDSGQERHPDDGHLCGTGDQLHVPGLEHRQRHDVAAVDRRHHDRACRSAADRRLPATDHRTGHERDLHRGVHGDPGRHRQRVDREQRHGQRADADRDDDHLATVGQHRRRGPGAGAEPDEDRVAATGSAPPARSSTTRSP